MQDEPAYLQGVNWEDIRFFLAVQRTGQIARAALHLGVDATTVGRRLRRLEMAVGERLFERSRDGQHLTLAGERLIQQAEIAERAIAEIDRAGQDETEVSGLLRVSVSEGFGTWFVAHYLSAFTRAWPGVTVDLVATSGFLSPSRKETDIAILLARPQHGPLLTRKLTDYALGAYVSNAYLAQHGPIENVEALHDHPLIGYVPDLLQSPELRYLKEISPRLEPRIRSSSINAQYRLTAAGAGVAILPAFIGGSDSTLTRILPEIAITRSFWLVTHEDTRSLARVRLFVDWLVALTDEKRDRLMPDPGKAPRPSRTLSLSGIATSLDDPGAHLP